MVFTQQFNVLIDAEPAASASVTSDVIDLRDYGATVRIVALDILASWSFGATPTGTMDLTFVPMALSGTTQYDDDETAATVTCTGTTHAARWRIATPTPRFKITFTNSTNQNVTANTLDAYGVLQGVVYER